LIAKAKGSLDIIQKEKDILHKLQTGQNKGGWLTLGDNISWSEILNIMKTVCHNRTMQHNELNRSTPSHVMYFLL
jgi:hypothetical protein